MKRIIVLVLLVLVYASGFSIDTMLGLNLGLTPMFKSASMDVPLFFKGTLSYTRYFFDIGAFLDLTYIRADVTYSFALGDTAITTLTPSSGTAYASTNTNAMSVLGISLIAKLPIEISKSFAIWPAIGIEYDIVLFSGANGTNSLTNDYDDQNDFFIKAGVGADIQLTENLYLIPSVMFAYDLTPDPTKTTQKYKDANGGQSWEDSKSAMKASFTAYKFDFNLGIAYKF